MTDENQDQLIHQILANGGAYDDLLHRPLLDATRQIARGVSVSASLRTQILDDVMELWQNPPFLQIRAAVNEIFSEISDPQFADEVSSRLLEIPTIESARIVSQLGKKEEATTVLLTLAQKEIKYQGDDDDILAALVALGEIGDNEKASSFLLEIAKDHQFEENARVYAIESIAKFTEPDSKVTSTLLELAHNAGTDPWVRTSAVYALVKLDESQLAIPILREVAANPEIDTSDRAIAATRLGEAGEKELAISILLELLHDPQTHEYVACCIAKDLVSLGERKIGMEFLTTPGQLEVVSAICGREIVYEELIRLGEQETVISLLLPMLQERTIRPSERISCAIMLAKLGKTREALPVLLNLVRSVDLSAHYYGQALLALGKWGKCNEEILNLLLNKAQNENIEPLKRTHAIEALGNYGDSSPRVLEFLAEIARNDPDTYSRIACEVLWKLTECSNLNSE